jgi:isopentenyldiphosphate isomerase
MITVFGKNALHTTPGYHRSIHIFVEVFGGKFLLQKKSKGTENAGRWSSAVSGHVRYKEGYIDAAIREADEELGLAISTVELHKVTKMPPSAINGYEFSTLFTYLMDPETEKLTLDPTEVDEIVIARLMDVVNDVEKHRNEYSPAFVELFNIFLALERGIEGVG